MIILEGADNCGKTTLGERLSRDLQVPLVHSERADKRWWPDEVMAHSMTQLAPRVKIQDRVYAISERVYGPIIRGKSDLGHRHTEALMDLLNRPYLVIYCRPPLEIILNNQGRDQMEGVIQHHERLVEGYDSVMRMLAQSHKLDIFWYDWTSYDYVSLLLACRRHFKEFVETWALSQNIMGVEL